MNDLVINNPNLQDVCKQCGKLFSSKYECSCKIKERVMRLKEIELIFASLFILFHQKVIISK